MASNEEFIKAAFKAGLSEEQVRKAVAERNAKTVEPEKTISQKIGSVPIVGDITNTLLPSITGALTKLNLPAVQKTTSEMQNESLRLTKLAQKETNPQKKAELLQKSKELSQGAGEIATNQDAFTRNWSGNFIDKESPTNFMESMKAYGPQAIRTGVTVGSLLAPGLAGSGLTGMAGTGSQFVGSAGARILGAGAQGSLMGGIYGAAAEDEATAIQRLEGALSGAATGAVVGVALQGLIEGAGGIKKVTEKLSKEAQSKLRDIYKNTLKQNIKDKKFYQQAGGEDKVTRDAIRYNIPSTKDGVVRELERYQPEYSKLVKEKSAQAARQNKRIDIKSAYERAKEETLKRLKDEDDLLAGANKYFANNDSRFLNQSNVRANPESANRLRVRIDQKVGATLIDETKSGEIIAKKAFASQLRNAFKETIPELKPAIRRYQLLSGLSEAMQKEPKMGITEVAMAAAGPGTGFYNILEFLGAKAIRSPGLKREVVKQLSRTSTQGSQNAQKIISPFRSESLRRILTETMNQ